MNTPTRRRLLPALLCSVTVGMLAATSSAAGTRAPVIKVGAARIYSAPVKVRPRQMAFGADGRMLYSHLSWSDWGQPVAKASGVLEVNLGRPSSRYQRFPSVVEASDLQLCDGTPAYTEIWWTTTRPVTSLETHRMSGFPLEDWHHCAPTAATQRTDCGSVVGELAQGQVGETWSFYKTIATGTSCAVAVELAKQFGPLGGSALDEGKSGVRVDGFTCWDLERIELNPTPPTSRCVRRNADVLLYNGGY